MLSTSSRTEEYRPEENKMYTMKVQVPRVTSERLAALEKEMPGFRWLAKLPLITNVNEARDFAFSSTNASLRSQECVSDILSATETDTGWEVELKIFD
jgi:hypothetical protein